MVKAYVSGFDLIFAFRVGYIFVSLGREIDIRILVLGETMMKKFRVGSVPFSLDIE